MSGTLTFYGEIIIIATAGIWGTLSDKFGRRPLMAGTYLIIALSNYLYPRATDYSELILARSMFALGIGGYSCIIVTLMADYVDDRSRGKAAGMLGMQPGETGTVKLPAGEIEVKVLEIGLSSIR